MRAPSSARDPTCPCPPGADCVSQRDAFAGVRPLSEKAKRANVMRDTIVRYGS
jgi:hypothetical protein